MLERVTQSTMFKTLNIRALFVAAIASLLLVVSVVLGSRRLQNFDAALIAYLFGTIFASFGIVYRYVVWLQRPPTKLYWKKGWSLFFSGNFLPLGLAVLKRFWNDAILQRFVL